MRILARPAVRLAPIAACVAGVLLCLPVHADAQRVDRLRDACEGGNARACAELGVAYMFGAGVPKDAARGAALSERACDGGIAGACRSGTR